MSASSQWLGDSSRDSWGNNPGEKSLEGKKGSLRNEGMSRKSLSHGVEVSEEPWELEGSEEDPAPRVKRSSSSQESKSIDAEELEGSAIPARRSRPKFSQSSTHEGSGFSGKLTRRLEQDQLVR